MTSKHTDVRHIAWPAHSERSLCGRAKRPWPTNRYSTRVCERCRQVAKARGLRSGFSDDWSVTK